MAVGVTGADRAVLSRRINRGIEITEQVKALEEELKELKNQIWEGAGQEPGRIKSSKGLCEIRVSQVVELPSGDDTRATLCDLVGQRFADLVEEKITMKPKEGFRRILIDPNPAEVKLAEALRKIARIREQLSFRFIGEG